MASQQTSSEPSLTLREENQTCSTNTNEISEIKQVYVGRCRVTSDSGEYKYVITIQPMNFDVTIKFHLRASYPNDIPDIVIRSTSLNSTQNLSLLDVLNVKAKELRGQPMIHQLMQLAQEKLPSFGLKQGKVAAVESHTVITDKSRKMRRKGKKKRTPKSENEVDEEKKKPMKTADDVIKRILWDESLDKDDFIVGYIDRFRGLLEKYFSAFSWEDLAIVDYDVLAVPKHRIQYFKYKTVKVWDKTRRMDNVFGSAEGTKTIDIVIKEMDELEGRLLNDNSSDTAALQMKDEADSSSDDSSEESSDEDDLVVTIGATANIGGTKLNASDAVQEKLDKNEQQDNYNPYWRDKLRPNYFICVRITNPTTLDQIGQVQDHFLEREPLFAECCIPLCSLHVTLCTVGLDTAEQLVNCMNSLTKMKEELKAVLPKSVLKLHGTSHFYQRVVYAKVIYDNDFMKFCDTLKLNLREAGIDIRDGYEFVPHMTIMKTTRPVSRIRGTKNIDPSLYQPFVEKHYGEESMSKICLCSMSSERREDGFYLTALELDFKE